MRQWRSKQDLSEKQSSGKLEHFELFEREKVREREREFDFFWSELKSAFEPKMKHGRERDFT